MLYTWERKAESLEQFLFPPILIVFSIICGNIGVETNCFNLFLIPTLGPNVISQGEHR